MAGESVKRQALADDCLAHLDESLSVSHLASIEPERLLIEVAKQMERFDRDIGALDGALQERPEVFEAVDVDLPIDVSLRVVNDLVDVILVQSVVGLERIGKDG